MPDDQPLIHLAEETGLGMALEGLSGDILLDLMERINRGATLEEAFALVADCLRRIFSIDRLAVVLLDQDGAYRITSTYGLSEAYLDSVKPRIAESPAARALAQRRPLYIPDVTLGEDAWPIQGAAREEGIRTLVALPLFWGASPLGYLVIYHDQVREYTPAEILLAQGLAHQASYAVQNARSLAEVEAHRAETEQRFQRRVEEAEAIDEIVLRISSSLDLESTLQAIADAAAGLSSSPYGCIYLLDSDGKYRARASHGVPLERLQRVVLSPTDGLMAQMRELGRPVAVSNLVEQSTTTAEAREEVDRTHNVSTLGVPLVRDGEVEGALYIGRTVEGEFEPDSVRTLQRLASFAQVALRNAQRYSRVESERRRLQAYLDAIPEGVMVFDREGRVVMLNESVKRELGTKADLAGRGRDEVLTPHSPLFSRRMRFRYQPHELFNRVLETGRPEQGLIEMEAPPRTFEMNFNPLRRNGRIEGIVATLRDITIPLQLGRERTRSHLLAQLLDLSAQLNADRSVSSITERVVEAATGLVGARGGTVGLVEGDVLVFRRLKKGDTWLDIDIRTARGEGVSGHVWDTQRAQIANDYPSDAHALPPLGEEFDFRRLVAVPLVDREGTLVGTLEVHDPIVEREFGQADIEALQLLSHQAAIAIENTRLAQLKDEFLSIVSHELKTPVTSIKGFTQVLQRRLSAQSLEQGGRYLEIINHQADRLATLINDLLDLSRIQSGRFSFSVSTIDYGQLVRDVVAEMDLVTPGNQLSLSAPERIMVSGNADRLRQVLINLIDNAVKHGPSGGNIDVSVLAEDGRVVTSVTDRGDTMPPGVEERVFDPYYQVRPGGGRHVQGLGLGLFVSRQIVEAHGGRIWVERNGGTSFWFSLSRA